MKKAINLRRMQLLRRVPIESCAINVSVPNSTSAASSAGRRELHLFGVLDNTRGTQNLEADDTAILAKVGDHARTHLVALPNRSIPKRNDERIGLAIINYLHGYFLVRYFAILDVL